MKRDSSAYPSLSYNLFNPILSDGLDRITSDPVQHESQLQSDPPTVVQHDIHIESHMIWSIFNICCCFWVLGSIACVFSFLTLSARKNGNLQDALDHSRTARTINKVATLCGVVILIIAIIHILIIMIMYTTSNRTIK